jgi:uncharacterized SAM-binding protein YcdF (DUF218 family)
MFVLSKIGFELVRPGNVLLLALVVGIILLWLRPSRSQRWGRALITAATLVLLLMMATPLPDWLLAPLENRFPMLGKMPERVDGIIVLGGAIDEIVTAARGEVALTPQAARLTEAMSLARRHPEARVLFTGGSGRWLDGDTAEANAAALFFNEMGLDSGRLLLEDRSRNTYENALFAKRLANPKPGEHWVLITSASHMPRAVGCFRAQGWDVIPFPVDYRTSTDPRSLHVFDLAAAAMNLDTVVKEWLGLAAYRLMGRTDSFFPGPAS